MPPDPGLLTVTGTVAALAIAEAGMFASTLVELTTVVASATPLNVTTAPVAKFAPSTSSWNPQGRARGALDRDLDRHPHRRDPGGSVPAQAASRQETGTVAAAGLEYPHPKPSAARVNNSRVFVAIFIAVPMGESSPNARIENGWKGRVRPVSLSCQCPAVLRVFKM